MSFRKRNIPLSQSGPNTLASAKTPPQSLPGVKPSPVTGSQTTSTGTASLDKLLGLGAGLALGSSVLIEEEGTTDFASSLIRCFAAEGVVQGHSVFIVSPEGSLVLPEVVEESNNKSKDSVVNGVDKEKMKIAWRYERLGDFTGRTGGLPQRQPIPPGSNEQSQNAQQQGPQQLFCHTFDLTKRLTPPPSGIPLTYLSPSISPKDPPFSTILSRLTTHLSTNPSTPTRLVIPTLLSPFFYPPSCSQPNYLLAFLHQLRALLRTYTALTAMISWPLALYPRHLSLTRWIEHILDGVIELQPFPHAYSIDAEPSSSSSSGSAKSSEEKMQGLLRVLKVPVLSERGVGLGSIGGEDMAFAVGRKRFVIRPFHLPPVEGDDGGGGTGESDSSGNSEKQKAKDLEF